MQIIYHDNEVNELKNDLMSKRGTFYRFYVLGYLHEGHHKIINIVKKQCDKLIVVFSEPQSYLYKIIYNWNNRKLLEDFKSRNLEFYASMIDSTKNNPSIDYFFIHKLDTENILLAQKAKSEVFQIYSKCLELNLSAEICSHLMFSYLNNPLEDYSKAIFGPKTALVPMLISKLIRELNLISSPKDHILKFIKDENGNVISRSRVSTELNYSRKANVELLKRGYTNTSKLKEVMFDYYVKNGELTILDLNNGNKLEEINENCSIVLMSNKCTEFIYIVNGELIY